MGKKEYMYKLIKGKDGIACYRKVDITGSTKLLNEATRILQECLENIKKSKKTYIKFNKN